MNKALALLVAVIAAAEALIMVLLALITADWIDPWFPALLDATAISLVAIVTVYGMNKNGWIDIKGGHTQRESRKGFVQIKIGVIVFTVEAILMLALEVTDLGLKKWQEAMLDVVLLAGIASLLIFWTVLKPICRNGRDQETQREFDPISANGVVSYAGGMLLLALLLLSAYEQQVTRRQAMLESNEMLELMRVKSAFLNRLNQASLDALTLSLQSDLAEWVNERDQSARIELENDYFNMARIKSHYDQIRFIDSDGNEVIRVDHEGGKAKILARDQFQNKSARYYFQHGMDLTFGEIFLSPLDLNMERGKVARPLKPIIRIVTVVKNDAEKKAGLIVINLKGEPLLEELNRAANVVTGRLSLLNQDGYWLFGAEREKLWGFMFQDKKKYTFLREHPEVWNKVRAEQRGSIQAKRGSYIFETVEFNAGQLFMGEPDRHRHGARDRHWPVWKLISFIPAAAAPEALVRLRNMLILLFLLIMPLSGLGGAMVVRALKKRREAERKTLLLAHYDVLTALANRSLFTETLTLELAHARRSKTPLALMFMDLDHFKPVNDELGHEAGDQVLRQVAGRLKACVRETDTLARLGGDEFAAIMPQPGTRDDISQIAERIIECFKKPFQPLGYERQIGISIGITITSGGETSGNDLLCLADRAMYEAKEAGRNCYQFSNATVRQRSG